MDNIVSISVWAIILSQKRQRQDRFDEIASALPMANCPHSEWPRISKVCGGHTHRDRRYRRHSRRAISEKFSAVAAKVAPGTLVWLASNGGKTFEAMKIGELIRGAPVSHRRLFGRGLRFVSCALMRLAGTTRYIHPHGAVGFHCCLSVRGPGGRAGLETRSSVPMTNLSATATKPSAGATSAPPTGALWVKAGNTRLHGIDWQSIGK